MPTRGRRRTRRVQQTLTGMPALLPQICRKDPDAVSPTAEGPYLSAVERSAGLLHHVKPTGGYVCEASLSEACPRLTFQTT
jgi:hypothetical protein